MQKRVIANIGIIVLSTIFLFACAAGEEQCDIGRKGLKIIFLTLTVRQ